MSEYWKSTPKFWCKFCKTFVRDTTLEKKSHDATPRHQNNIQRSLRELHKGQEREDRDKQRAKDEVARLNGLVGGKSGASGPSAAPQASKPSNHAPRVQEKVTLEARKRQMEQLAALGVAIPEEHRKKAAGLGGWTVVSETPIYEKPVEGEDTKPAVSSFGVRKRKLDDEEEELAAIQASTSKRNWGSTLKSYPGSKGATEDLNTLLGGSTTKDEVIRSEDKQSESAAGPVKTEDSTVDLKTVPPSGDATATVKVEDSPAVPAVVFKKRKGVKR